MRKKNSQSTAKVTMESNIPDFNLTPVSVGATENDTRIEWVEETLRILFKLSWVEETPEQFMQRHSAVKAKLEDWTEFYYSRNTHEMVDLIRLFLTEYYDRKYAYIKTPSGDIYGQVEILDEWEMRTEEWILTMPMVRIGWRCIFFPVSAILTSDERGLYEMYRDFWTAVSQKDALEKEIVELMLRLSTMQNDDIKESNWFMKEISDYCEHSWTVQKLTVRDWKIILDFAWRYGKDTDWRWESWVVLPPCQITIDIANHSVRWGACYHPHILSGHSLCMGWDLSEMVNNFLNNKSVKWLVECMIMFANSYTSTDCWLQNDDRAPAACLKRYCYESSGSWTHVDYANLPVRLEDIMKTAVMYWSRPRESFWMEFRNWLRDYLFVGQWQEIIDIVKEKYWIDRVKQMLITCSSGELFRQKMEEFYNLTY